VTTYPRNSLAGRRGWLGRRPEGGLGGCLGRGVGLGAHQRVELLLPLERRLELVGVLKRAAEQRLAVGSPCALGRRGLAQLGGLGGRLVDQLLEGGNDPPLLALLQPALGDLDGGAVAVAGGDRDLQGGGAPRGGRGDAQAQS
jgi:hypothetical protein